MKFRYLTQFFPRTKSCVNQGVGVNEWQNMQNTVRDLSLAGHSHLDVELLETLVFKLLPHLWHAFGQQLIFNTNKILTA